MIITIASIHIEIDDTILNEEIIQQLKPFISTRSQVSQGNLFEVHLSYESSFLSDITLESRLKHLYYQETESQIIIADQFSGLLIDIKNNFMRIFSPEKRYSKSIDILSDLKLYFSLIVLQYGGVLLHSSAVFRDQKAMVFIGESGAGKSTIYNILSSKWQNLNDDLNVLIPSNGGFKIFSTPFGKNIGRYDRAPLVDAIFLLKKSIINKFSPLMEQPAILNLLRSSCSFPSSEFFAQKLFDNILHIKSLIPFRELYFSRNSSILDFFDSNPFSGKLQCSTTK